MLTAATTVGIRIRKVPRIHTVPTTEAPVGLCFEYCPNCRSPSVICLTYAWVVNGGQTNG
jgi:hypothetical protein